MNDDFVESLISAAADLQRLGMTNAQILHELAQLRHELVAEYHRERELLSGRPT